MVSQGYRSPASNKKGLLSAQPLAGVSCQPTALIVAGKFSNKPTKLPLVKGPVTDVHFSNPPPPPSAGVHVPPPPRRAIFRSPRRLHTSLLLVLFGGWSAQALTDVSYLSFSADGLQRRLHNSPTCPFRRLSYLSFSADGLHRRLQMSPTCPFRRMVCTGVYTTLLLVLFGGSPTCPFRRMVCTGAYTCLLLVLFGGRSAQALTHLSYLPFSADGLHRPFVLVGGCPACPFRRMVGFIKCRDMNISS